MQQKQCEKDSNDFTSYVLWARSQKQIGYFQPGSAKQKVWIFNRHQLTLIFKLFSLKAL